jgi:hypothetical protein
MLAGLPVRMAEGGVVEDPLSAGRRRAIANGNEAGWLQNVAKVANTWMGTPGTAAEAYDAMVKSGISVQDLRDAGIAQESIDKALSIPTPEAQKQVNALTAKAMTTTLSQNPTLASEIGARGAPAIYAQARDFVSNLQKDGLTDAERQQLQQVATQQGWGFADIRAAGIDPNILFKAPAAAAPVTPAPVTPSPVTPSPVTPSPVTPGPFPQPEPYTPVTVYDADKFAREQGGEDLYKKGEVALDTAFRSSPVRQVSPTTGQYTYTPAAQLRPATGSGWSWKPPVVTSRPRELLDVAPTASASQMYAQSRQQQDRALRDAFAASNLPMSGANTYYWQSRLRGGDYSPGGTFDTAKFGQDFQSWAASQGSGTSGTAGSSQTGGAIEQNQQMYDEFGNPIPSQAASPLAMAPKMFLGMQPQMFADGGEAKARELLDRLKKSEGDEESSPAASGRGWEGGRSPEQNRRFNRIKPALDRERERLEAWYDRNPEDFYARIFADLPPEERRYMEYVMAGLPPEHRFDAPAGLMSLIGYGTGDNRATISEYSVKDKLEDGYLSPRVLGFYPRSNFKRSQENYPHDDPRLQWAPGQEGPDAQAGIAVFSPTEDNIISEKYRSGVSDPALVSKDIYGTSVMRSLPNTVWHELFHRGADSPFLTGSIGESLTEPRFYADDHQTLAALMQEYAAENAENLPSDLPFDPEKKREYYNQTVEEINRFLTPEREAEYQVTRYHDPSERSFMERVTEDVLRKKDGGEVSTEELIAQMDRIGSTPSRRTPQEDPVKTESRGLLDRLNSAFFENVTKPVVGSAVDMTVGLGDIAQLGTKYLAGRAGVETEPFAPVSGRVQEALGVEGYDPYAPAAIGAQIAAGPIARFRSAAAPALSAATRATVPGSADDMLKRLAGDVAKEGQVYAGAEAGAQIAREVAPDNFGAELVGSMLGGTGVNTAISVDPRDMSRSAGVTNMASYTPYPFARGREYPFVGRLDQYVADNVEGTLTKDQFLGQIRPKFREYDILRAERALSDLGGKDKLTAADLLTRLEQVYDPADFKMSVYKQGNLNYTSVDNPWRGGLSENSSATGRFGTISLSRGGVEGSASPSLDPNTLNLGRDILQQFTGSRALVADSFLRGETLGQVSILRDIVNELPDSTEQNRLRSYISDLEDAVGLRPSIARKLDVLQEDKDYLLKLATRPSFFEPAMREALERGGAPPEQLLDQAFNTAISRAYASQTQYLWGYNEFFPVDLDLTGAVSYDDKVQAIASQIGPAAARAKQQLQADTADTLNNTLTAMEGYAPEFEKLFKARTSNTIPGSNPGFRGQHPELSASAGNQIGFSRFSEVEAPLPGGTAAARGIYVHELQADLLDDIRKKGMRGEGVPELEQRLQRAMQEKDKATLAADQAQSELDMLSGYYGSSYERELAGDISAAQGAADRAAFDQQSQPLIEQLQSSQNRAFSVGSRIAELEDAVRNAKRGKMPDLDESFPGMERNSKAVQQLLIRNAVAAAVDQNYQFVALTAPEHSSQPQLYSRIAKNASDVVKDLGEGFRVVDLTLEGSGGPFKTTAIVWGDDSAEGREAVQRVLTRGVPFAKGGEVTSKPDDIKNLLSFLDK